MEKAFNSNPQNIPSLPSLLERMRQDCALTTGHGDDWTYELQPKLPQEGSIKEFYRDPIFIGLKGDTRTRSLDYRPYLTGPRFQP